MGKNSFPGTGKTGVGLLACNLNLLNFLSVTWFQQLVDTNLLPDFRKDGEVVRYPDIIPTVKFSVRIYSLIYYYSGPFFA